MFKIGSRVQLYKCVFGECEACERICKDRLETGIVIDSDNSDTTYRTIFGDTEASTTFVRQIETKFDKHKRLVCKK